MATDSNSAGHGKDVVITAVGAITALGVGFDALKAGLRRGKPCLGPVSLFPDEPEARQLRAGQVTDFDPKLVLGSKGLRNKDRLTLLLLGSIGVDLAGAIEAIGDPKAIGLVAGTTFSSLTSQIEFTSIYERDGVRALNAMAFPNMVLNTPPSQANIWFDLEGSSTTLTNGFTAGLDALMFASDQIRCGRAVHMVAGGADDLALAALRAFERRRLLSASGQLRPLDEQHDGTLLGEGAAVMLLEQRAAAEHRGAEIVAEVLGYGSAFDGSAEPGYSASAAGASQAMQIALDDAGLAPEQIDFLSASASGIPSGDEMEERAIHRVFGDHVASLPVVAYSSYWGNCLGASGAMQAAAAVADLRDGVVSATCGFERGSGQLATCTAALAAPAARVAMINAFGLTGTNSSLILRRPC